MYTYTLKINIMWVHYNPILLVAFFIEEEFIGLVRKVYIELVRLISEVSATVVPASPKIFYPVIAAK